MFRIEALVFMWIRISIYAFFTHSINSKIEPILLAPFLLHCSMADDERIFLSRLIRGHIAVVTILTQCWVMLTKTLYNYSLSMWGKIKLSLGVDKSSVITKLEFPEPIVTAAAAPMKRFGWQLGWAISTRKKNHLSFKFPFNCSNVQHLSKNR